MPRINRLNLTFKFLTIAAGMEGVADVVMPKDRQLGKGIADKVICFSERFSGE